MKNKNKAKVMDFYLKYYLCFQKYILQWQSHARIWKTLFLNNMKMIEIVRTPMILIKAHKKIHI